MLLWLCTVCRFAASKHCPRARRTKALPTISWVLLLSLVFFHESSKDERATRILWELTIEIVVPVTPLAVVVVDTFDWRPPNHTTNIMWCGSWIIIFVEWNYFWLKLNKYFCWMKIISDEVEQILYYVKYIWNISYI